MLEQYRKHVEERAAEGVVPKPLDAEQMAALVELIKDPPEGEEEFILNLLANRVPAGVDEAASFGRRVSFKSTSRRFSVLDTLDA